MPKTIAFLSARFRLPISCRGATDSYTGIVKARSFDFEKGWYGSPKFFSDFGMIRRSPLQLIGHGEVVIKHRQPSADIMPRRVLASFGILALYAASLHGNNSPCVIGNLKVQPYDMSCGSTPMIGFLVTEASGGDCGTWEEDQEPARVL